ncbi:SDR family oxidoreductase [Rothia sp. P100]|uniref:SDR family NAD(P)-dependent oxidoreductase n=1 Tax=Rothia sp. P100 TaxID=2939578 RepID=UPI00203E0956|nr:SDR family oxidoreductase [Rothia sp. P100]MCM3511007.1 SDR family oxidoreductase [Rothia sp. P100]
MSIDPSYVLITGASAGIGAEFARQYAAAGYHLVLTARRVDPLQDLAEHLRAECGVNVEVLPADLLNPDDLERLVARLQQDEAPVEILVNNAGFGLGSSFDAATAQQHLAQVDVLAKVPLLLMHTAITTMLPRGRGRIINVASVAAFTPGGTYSAVKRFLVSISESANLQYAPRGITVTAVCPGLTRSEFHDAMGQVAPSLPGFLWLTPQRVVADATAASHRGKALCVPSVPYKVAVGLTKVLPRAAVARLIARTRNY